MSQQAKLDGRLAAALLLLGACRSTPDAPPPPPPTEVAILEVKPEPVTIRDELPGRVVPFRMAQVRGRVPGIVLKRTFSSASSPASSGCSTFSRRATPPGPPRSPRPFSPAPTPTWRRSTCRTG